MELITLIEGLKLAFHNNLKPLEINTDSMIVIHMLHKGNLHNLYLMNVG